MKKISFLFLFFVLGAVFPPRARSQFSPPPEMPVTQTSTPTSTAPLLLPISTEPISHKVFSQILQKYVNKQGLVDYSGLKRDKDAQANLKAYLDDLMKIDGSELEPVTERMAYWLNLYNGLVIQEVLKNYPVQTVSQIPHFFDGQRYEIAGFNAGKKVSLLDIEGYFHDRFNEPRLHLMRVNGALSSPPMMREAYEGPTIERKLEDQTTAFLKDTLKNNYDARHGVFLISPLFLWFQEDFERYAISPEAFVTRRVNMPPNTRIQYMGFDWKLNDTKNR